VVVAGSLAGIGFTMSIFLADLAFPAGDRLVASKSAILVASALATVTGLILGRLILPETAAVTDVGNLPDEHNPDNKNPSRVAEGDATKTSETQKRQGVANDR
jgi:nucleoside permease NupC